MTESDSDDEVGERAKRPPDVIFIDAGINALAAALVLGEAGWRVLVLERNKEPGGAVRTLELTLPGFRHELGAMNLNPLASSLFYEKFGKALTNKGLELISADPSSGLVLPGGRFLGITKDREANLRAIAGFSALDAEAWKTWNADFDRCAPYLFRILGSPPARAGPLKHVFDDEDGVPDSVRQTLREILFSSLSEVLTTRFESDAVQAMIAAWTLHFDYAPDIAGGCWYPFIEINVGQQSGAMLAKGGSGRVASALADLISDVGGEVRTEQTFEKIVVEDGRAVGVRSASGEELRASRAIVACVTPTALLKLTDGHLTEREANLARNYRYGPGALLIHLALSDLPNWRAEGARRCFYIHVGSFLDYLAATYQQAMAGLLSAEPFFCITQPTLHDPSIAPGGHHVLRIFVRAVPAEIRGDAGRMIQGQTWTEEVKESFADHVLDLVEEHAPGIRDKILAKVIQSPLDLEELNPNLVDGDNNAGSMQLAQFYWGRPFPGSTDQRMPISGLYMCGAATWPGGGTNPGSGVFVAQEILADNQ